MILKEKVFKQKVARIRSGTYVWLVGKSEVNYLCHLVKDDMPCMGHRQTDLNPRGSCLLGIELYPATCKKTTNYYWLY